MAAIDWLTEIATAIADGRSVDWASAEARAVGPDQQAAVQQLRVLENIALSHASPPDEAPTTVYESLLHPDPDKRATDLAADAPVTWGPLTIIEKVGSGTFGDVYRAHDPRLDRTVALKLLRRREHGEAVESAVIEEGRLMARVQHPNVVTVYGAERIEGRVGVWMEFVEGRTLEEQFRLCGPFEPAAVVQIGIDLCGALEAVHRAGLLHRDLKAQNVIRRPDGRIVLTDFGAGREVLDTHADGQTVELAGTPLYIAPEVLEGQPASVQSEVYGLGVLLFHLATGSFPVQASNLRDLRDAHARRRRTQPEQSRLGVSRRLAIQIERAIDPRPARRFQTTQEFEASLRRLSMSALSSRPAFVAAALLAVLGLGVLSSWVWNWADRRNQPSMLVCDGCFGPDVEIRGIATISSDGRWIVAADAGPDHLRIRDLSTGVFRSLDLAPAMSTEAAPSDGPGRITNPVFSPDSRRIALLRYSRSAGSPRLWIADLTGLPPRLVLASAEIIVEGIYDWAPDGRSILISLQRIPTSQSEPIHELAWASPDGNIRTVKSPWGKSIRAGTYGWIYESPPAARISPDGRYIAYAETTESEAGGSAIRHIYLLNGDGSGQQTDAVVTSADNTNPAWSSRGDRLYFTSNVSNSVDLWSVGVTNGQAVNALRTERSDVGDARALTISENGAYFFRPVPQRDYIYIIDTLPSSRAIDMRPKIRQVVAGRDPKWSDDGGRLRFLRRRANATDPRLLWSAMAVSMRDNHEEREPAEEPEGTSLFRYRYPPVRGLSLQQARAFESAVERAPWSLVYGRRAPGADLPDDEGTDVELAPVALGETLYAFRSDSTREIRTSRIMAIDTATGKVRLQCALPDRPPSPSEPNSVGLSLSSDGRTLAMALSTKGRATLGTVSLESCEYHAVYGPYRTEGTRDRVAWTSDGRSIFVSEEFGDANQLAYRIVKIPVAGGKPEALITLNGPDRDSSFDLSATGLLALHPNPAFEQPFARPGTSQLQLWRLHLPIR